jgi:hypothetical protein
MPSINTEKRRQVAHNWYIKHKKYVQDNLIERRQKRKIWFRGLKKSLACKVCGESHPACIDFHHPNPDEKDGDVSRMVRSALSEETILAEIAKCEVLCSNCHRKLHWDEEL